MIEVKRPPEPGALKRNGAKWKQKLLKAQTKREKKLAKEKYRHSDVKATLVTMFGGKCAYCESRITHLDYGHIEHYRPKSRFPKLTFEWSNLLLACGVCNGAEHKGGQFPDRAGGGPLVNPCDDNPSDHFRFQYDPDTKLASVYGTTTRGETTEKLLGLNRHWLRKYRSEQVRKLVALARFARSDPDARVLLNEACQGNAEYAAFARTLCGDWSINDTRSGVGRGL
ncbi:MAG: TIGR02646 family protein [Phycisphaerae bacterium]|nr:TIGR02646 family protein [Phycisphaerae bacterium]